MSNESAASGAAYVMADTPQSQTGWERVAHRLPDEIEALRAAIDMLAARLEPFLTVPEAPASLQEVTQAPHGAQAIIHAEEQIERIRDCRSRLSSIIERLDI